MCDDIMDLKAEEGVPAKKMKLSQVADEIQIDTEAHHPDAILADEYTRAVELIECIACPIVDKKRTSTLVKEISNKIPLVELRHLKRVRSRDGQLHILICHKHFRSVPEGVDSKTNDDALESDTISCEKILQGVVESCEVDLEGVGVPCVVQVPRHMPYTRAQYEAGVKHWPTQFHEDKQVAKMLKHQFFSKEECLKIHEFMTKAVGTAKQGCAKGSCLIGAVVVDPVSNEVIAMAHDLRTEHPLQHATMVCIDLVGRAQGGGAWKYHSDAALYSRPPSQESSPPLDPKTGPYLCTGYDLYVTHEPCTMCCMALVHSRVRRVFYGCGTEDGGLGTKYKIHVQAGLNHHFEVFAGVQRSACEALNQCA